MCTVQELKGLTSDVDVQEVRLPGPSNYVEESPFDFFLQEIRGPVTTALDVL